MSIKKVGVVGCGQMGASIALLTAQAGLLTVVSELNEDMLNQGLSNIHNLVNRYITKGKLLKRDKDTVDANLIGTTKGEDFSDCDIVIEAIIEDAAEKKKLFIELDGACSPEAILASNTFSLPITDMASVTQRPDKVIGMRFFYPVVVMTLLEIVTTILSSEETVKTAKAFGESLGKSIIISKDEPGFVVNRLVAPFLLDAIRLLESGVASKEDIDASMVLGLNHPMGPLALADLIGLDTVNSIASSIYEEFIDLQYAPPILMKRMLAAGWLGRKTGKGFYEY